MDYTKELTRAAWTNHTGQPATCQCSGCCKWREAYEAGTPDVVDGVAGRWLAPFDGDGDTQWFQSATTQTGQNQ